MLEVFGNGALSFACASGCLMSSRGGQIHACFHCFFHLLQVFASTHEIVKFYHFRLKLFLFSSPVLLHDVVRGHDLLSTHL